MNSVLVPTMHVGCSCRTAECGFHRSVLVPTMHVGCSEIEERKRLIENEVLVPTMHVGCSGKMHFLGS